MTALALDRDAAAATPWRAHLLALAVVAAAILALFHRDAADIAAIWWHSSTFNHCLLIPPLIAWLVWQRLPELRLLRPVGWLPGLGLTGLGAAAWLVGDAGGVALGRHLGLVLMLQGAVVACLGLAVTRGLLFPIAFALFLVPVGEELVPALQSVTAGLAMALLDLTGVPAHIEGIFITTPAGYFEVAEACAGVKFLVAMLAFGALVCNTCFRSWTRRAAFMAAAIVVPILANGIRAWGTIYLAGIYGIEFAAGFDHVIYGGIFFAIVIALLIVGAWPFFDRGIDDPWLDGVEPQPRRAASLPLVAAIAMVVAALPLAWSQGIAATSARPLPGAFALPEVDGWTRIPAQGRPWQPAFAAADLYRAGRYRDRLGREVDLVVAGYARQSEGRELVGFGQGAAAGWAWTADAAAPLGGRAERIGSHGLVREVLIFYRVGTVLSGSETGVKLETLKGRLLGGPQQAVAVLVSAPAPAAGANPRPAIDDFVAALGPIEALADRAAGRTP